MKDNVSLEDLKDKKAEVTAAFEAIKREAGQLEAEVEARNKRLNEIRTLMVRMQGEFQALESLEKLITDHQTPSTDVQS